MSQPRVIPLAAAHGSQPLTAVIDIGSNSVRMVVFSGTGRAPVPIFNERTLCGLGRSLNATGRLDPHGVETALKHLARFAALTKAMDVSTKEVLATEAVRAAADGDAFVAEAEVALGAPITILDGETEAEASALGVVSGIPDADGIMGDLGGGSLEVVALDRGVPGTRATLPLGSLRLREDVQGATDKARKLVDAALKQVDWLGEIRGRTFYPVGGAWRAFASVHMGHYDYPLHIIDQYSLSRAEALSLLTLVSGLSLRSLAKIPRVPKARLATLPTAAVVMERLISLVRPARIVFSANGLREGWLYRRLPMACRAEDPLIAGCSDYAARTSRFRFPSEALSDWITPLFPNQSPRQARLLYAAAILSDIGWRDHPDYRAQDMFSRVLHLPVTGLDHAERVILAFAVSASYGGGRRGPAHGLVRPLINDRELDFAMNLGRALRLARTLSGGAMEMLHATQLELTPTHVVLRLPKGASYLVSDTTARRFSVLAQGLHRRARVVA